MVQILEISSTTGVCHWYAAPLCQFLNQFLVNSLLETFIIRCVDQKFRTVWLEGFDRSYCYTLALF